MLSFIAFCISAWEFRLCIKTMMDTCGSLDIEEFLSKCTPESLWKCHCHAMLGIFTLQLSTVLSFIR